MVAREATLILTAGQQHHAINVNKVHPTRTDPTASGATTVKLYSERSACQLVDHPGGGQWLQRVPLTA